MQKFILKSKSKDELQDKIKNMIVLNDDEIVEITELKKPRNLFIFSTDGEYEVKIVKKEMKSSVKNIKSEVKNKEIKKDLKKDLKKEVKKDKVKVVEISEEKKVNNNDNKLIEKLNIVIKEFLAISNLNVIIKNISFNDKVYNVELDGEDIKYIIGEKGIALSSLEYLLMSIEDFRHIKIFIDSNNYKEKRETILRELANKTAKTVIKTRRKVKLNPMTSRERKIIHEEISKIEGLETVSVGVEPKRCLIIKLKK